MPSGGDFGPAGSGSGEAPPFAVAGPAQMAVDASRSGVASFTVSNVTGRPVRARVLVLPGAGAEASWFEVAGESERALPVAGTATVDVAVRVPAAVPGGTFSFVLGAALEESPDQVVSGPTVTFQVPEPEKRKFPWWIVIVAAAAVVVLVVGGLLIRNFTRSDPATEPSASPSPTETVGVVISEALAVPAGDSIVDFEGPEIWQFTNGKFIPGGDLYFFDDDVWSYGVPGALPLTISNLTSAGIAIVPDAEYSTCVQALEGTAPETYVEVPDSATVTYVCFITGERHYAMLEISPQENDRPTRMIEYIVWEGIA